MKFEDFQAPVLFSSTCKALNLGEKNSSTFNDFQGCVGSLWLVVGLGWRSDSIVFPGPGTYQRMVFFHTHETTDRISRQFGVI